MTPTFLRVMFWKEIRELAGFWIVLAAVGILIQVFLLSDILPDGFERPKPAEVIPIGSVLAGLFLVGCAGAQFAAERENGTYAFLRALPTGASPRLLCEAGGCDSRESADHGCAGYAGYMDSLLRRERGDSPGVSSCPYVRRNCPGSVLLDSPLLPSRKPSLRRHCVGPSLRTLPAVDGLALGNLHPSWRQPGQDRLRACWLRLAIVICFDIWLAGRWFRAKNHGGLSPLTLALSKPSDVFYPVAAPAVAWSCAPSAPALFARLLWQQTREAFSHWRYLLLVVVVAAAALLARCFASRLAFDILTGTAALSLFLLAPDSRRVGLPRGPIKGTLPLPRGARAVPSPALGNTPDCQPAVGSGHRSLPRRRVHRLQLESH